MERQKKVTLGADVEVFLGKEVMKEVTCKEQILERHPKTGEPRIVLRPTLTTQRSVGDIVPCVGIFKGTKEKPWEPKGWSGYGVQEDNVMMELNVPPTEDVDGFRKSITSMRIMARDLCQPKGLRPAWGVTAHEFKTKDLTSPQAQMFACDPDFDAYDGGAQRPPPPEFGNVRGAGGHIHIGGDFNCPDFVAVLFFELCLTMNMKVSTFWDKHDPRNRWYGRPGIFRSKPYGIEYRSPSNRWVGANPGVVAQVLIRTGNWLMRTPPETLQKHFRSFPWEKFRGLLETYNPKNPETARGCGVWNNKFSELVQIYNSFHIQN